MDEDNSAMNSYPKRPGTTAGISGHKFEQKMACLVFLRCVGSGRRFRLAANMDGVGAFDDLVLERSSGDGSTQIDYIQLKHKEKSITRNQLLSLNTKKEEFSLLKYFISYRDKICPEFETGANRQMPASSLDDVSLILYTNAAAQLEPQDADQKDDFFSTGHDGSVFSSMEDVVEDMFSFPARIQRYRTFLDDLLSKVQRGGEESDIIRKEVAEFIDRYKTKYPSLVQNGNCTIYKMIIHLRGKPTVQQITDHITNLKTVGELSNYGSFLKKLKFYTKQVSEDKLDKEILKELHKLFGVCYDNNSTIYRNLLEEVEKWWAAEDGTYLTEGSLLWDNTVRQVLGATNEETMREINKLGIKFNEKETEDMRSILNSSRVLVCLVEDNCTQLGLCRVMQTLNEMNDQFAFGLSHNAVGVWQSHWCNLLVVECRKEDIDIFSKVKEVIKCQPHKKLIVVSQKRELSIMEETTKLTAGYYVEVPLSINLTGLDTEIQERILAQKIMFQGYSVSLRELIHEQWRLMELVKDEMLLRMLKDKETHLGKRLEELKPHYVSRTLQRQDMLKPFFKAEFIQERDLILFVSGGREYELAQQLALSEEVRTFDGAVNPGCRFYVLGNNDLPLHLLDHRKYIHVVKKGSSGFQVQAFSSHKNMSQFVEQTEFTTLHPDSACDLPGRVVVIAAEPGMGKSTLTTSMALATKKKEPATWVIRVNLGGMTRELEKVGPEDIDKEFAITFLTKALSCTKSFDKQVFQHCVYSIGNVVVFFDGFDEICPNYENQMMAIFNKLLETKLRKMVITSRRYWAHKLEQRMKLIAFRIKDLSAEDQRNFLEKVWNEKVPNVDKDVLKINIVQIQTIFTNSHYHTDRNIIGIPLQIMIAAEVFQPYLMEGRMPKHLDIVELYEALFERKLQVYFEEKRKDNTSHPSVKRDLERKKGEIKEMHLVYAMELYLSSKDLKSLHGKPLSKTGVTYLEEMRDDLLSIGLLEKSADGTPEFLHRTIMEFFVSKWLIINYQLNIEFMRRKLFREEYFVVRRMFNILLAQDNELCTGIINNDVEYLKPMLNPANVNRKDKRGRTLLHVALTDGSWHHKSTEVVRMLLDLGADLEVTDKVLQWSAVQYADYSRNWAALEIIMERKTVNLKHIRVNVLPALNIVCMNGYLELARYLFNNCINDNDKESYLCEALFTASTNGQVKVIDYMLSVGADINEVTKTDHKTALHMAICSGLLKHTRIVSLLEYNPHFKPNSISTQRDIDTITLKTVKFLIDKGSKMNAQDVYNMTALHFAAMNENSDTVRLLIEKGSEVNCRDIDSNTPLHFSALRGNLDTVHLLIKKGGEVNAQDDNKNTALHCAASIGHLEIVRMLIENGGVVNAKDNNNRTALHCAANIGNLEIARLLIEKGAEVNTPDKNNSFTTLYCAASNGHLEIARLLIENGGVVNAIDNINRSALHSAAINGYLEIARLLIEKGTEVNTPDNNSYTALHCAAIEGHLEIARLLIDNGGEVNAVENIDRTALHYAAIRGNLETVRLLIEKGGEVNATDSNNSTALHCASRNGNLETVRLLIEKGGKVNAKDNNNYTALYFAASNGNLETVRLLIEKDGEVNATYSNNRTALHCASNNGNMEIVQLLIEKGGEVNATAEDNNTALHLAANNGHLDIVRLLIEKGSEVNAPDNNDYTALHNAANNGHLDTVRLLIEKGSEVNAPDNNDYTALHNAAINGHLDTVRLLIEKGGKVNAPGNNDYTALHNAAYNGHLDTVRLLIEKGGKVNAPGNNDYTALHNAANNGHLETVRLLIEKGSEVNAPDNNDYTALHNAANNGHLDIVRLLIEKGGNVNALTSNNNTALHLAANNGNLETVRLLIEKGSEVNAPGNNDYTALHIAAINGHLDTVRLLIEKGGEVNAPGNNDYTALHIAANNGHLDTVRLLIEKGSEVNAPVNNDYTALHIAANNGHLDTVRLLIEKGGNVNAPADNNYTALHCAAINGHLDTVRLLIEKGGNVNALNSNNNTALHCAAINGHLDTVRLLIEKGGKVNAPGNNDYTALHIAALNGHLDTVRLLIEKGGNVNAPADNNHTALHCAVINEHLDTVRLLIEKGGNVNALTINNNTALHIAANNGHLDTVRLLIEKGGDVRELLRYLPVLRRLQSEF